jgi:hypothetical protein
VQRSASAIWGTRSSQGAGSAENLYRLDVIRVEGEVTVSVDDELCKPVERNSIETGYT